VPDHRGAHKNCQGFRQARPGPAI